MSKSAGRLGRSGAWWLAIACFVAGGCGPQLETGYKYRPLNSTVEQRRAYYAPPYSPEQAKAEQERRQQNRPALPGQP